tara:strand:- start:27 stop:722 length:696 start_codon:yes stop_codon:yes gene_type:complete
MDEKVLDYIYSKIKKGFLIRDPVHFALLCKNHLDLADKNQGWETEKYFECITGFEIIAEDGIAIAQVGHKGDLKVEYGEENYYPNVKSTMRGTGRLWLKTDPNKMGQGIGIKVFDSSRTQNFSLPEKLKEIGNDLIIIHFCWHSIQLKGCVSITSLQEMAEHRGVNVSSLFSRNKNKEDASHYSIKADVIYDVARHHDRVLFFSTSEKEVENFLTKNEDFIKPSIVELMDK